VRGVFVATGHAMMGFLLGPLTGKLVSETILDGRASLETGMMRADRF
jgi:D-amino-acid dehydrogenase